MRQWGGESVLSKTDSTNLSRGSQGEVERSKLIIDDYFKAIEEMWEAGIFNYDAVLVNAGIDAKELVDPGNQNIRVRFFDLGAFALMNTREQAIGLRQGLSLGY